MSKEQIVFFLNEIKANPDLQHKLKSIKKEDEREFIKIANEAGFGFTAEEWSKYLNDMRKEKKELTDDELDNISGGGLFGITKCPERYDWLLCKLSYCPNVKKKTMYHPVYRTPIGSYEYCCKGFWDGQDE
ncbi:Nif11-like leader peptide family natural product precursor [Petroclostridium sp. X23]|uniref:Nif11-like leader peptide family natural product precursor n=1 Tax=Petroclostridium sp. X23 TaxID=3045146 RepID=UPI0024ACFB4F|nr:Nif11-like leader peptide family natural product precursor [Petroclostridium sp. X23]WHH58787.1 Nif11-like leader peptide family natural product precursor [Petroclostridium sp. X23]